VVHDRVEGRHEDEREGGRDDQAADHADGHRRAEFAAVTVAQRARDHAGDHGDGRHHDGPGALAAGIDDGFGAAHALGAPLYRVVDQHDRVLGHDPHQHEDADDHGHADRLV